MSGMPRNGTTCRNCQTGHQKCVKDGDSENCRRCQQRGIVCLHDPQLRVRNVVSVSQKNAQGKRKKRSLKYSHDQVWVPVPRILDFAPLEQPGDQTHQTEQGEEDPVIDACSPIRYEDQDDQFQQTTTSPSITRSDFGGQHDHSPDYCSASSTVATNSVFVPESQSESSAPPGGNFWPFHDSHEAHLFLHYVQRLSRWLDAMDSDRHFGTDVARRASHVPVIMNAILASSSRHIAFMSGTEDTNSARYHDECLQILIPVLDDPLDVLDENLFAAIIILRQYEEFDERDERCHLFGSTRMVDSVVNSSSYTSLRQAANWVALRQEIYVSLTNRQPVSIMLNAYRDSSYFHSDTEDAWANRMVFIFAKVLNYAFKPVDSVPEESWSELYDQVEAWNATKPRYFVPLWSENASTDNPSTFPHIIMLGPSQVNGMQHYCLARILLATYDPRLSRLGFDTQKTRKKSEETMLHFLRMVIGLATSNPHVESSFMHVSHILSACGHYFSDQYEREAACDVLRDIEQRGIWRTASIISQLQEQWSSE